MFKRFGPFVLLGIVALVTFFAGRFFGLPIAVVTFCVTLTIVSVVYGASIPTKHIDQSPSPIVHNSAFKRFKSHGSMKEALLWEFLTELGVTDADHTMVQPEVEFVCNSTTHTYSGAEVYLMLLQAETKKVAADIQIHGWAEDAIILDYPDRDVTRRQIDRILRRE